MTPSYPKNLLPIIATMPITDPTFEKTCEALLLNYTYQTARAYLCDLDSFHTWCTEQRPPIEPLNPTAADIQTFHQRIAK